MTARPLILGLDVGGTKLAAGVLDLGVDLARRRSDGNAPPGSAPLGGARAGSGIGERARAAGLRSFLSEPSRREEGPEAMIARLIELGRRAITEADARSTDLVAVGIGCGGPLDPVAGVIQRPMNLPDWDDVPLAELVSMAFDRPAAVENDATAATLAEHRFGAGRGAADIVYFTMSTGIGGGAISGGRLVRGATGNGAELGHLMVDPGLRPCACGRRGCLEGYASGTNIAARAREAIEAGEPSILTELAGGSSARITAETVVEGVRRRDRLARRIWDETTTAIGTGVANAINAFDPGLVILGGGVTRAGDLLLEPVRRVALAQAMRPMAANVRIVPAALGDQLGVVAAATVAIERFRIEDPRSAGAATALREHLAAASELQDLLPEIEAVGRLLCEAIDNGGRLVTFGNGGSAADAQHFAAELVGHFRRDRPGLPAIALTTDSSALTAIANDYAWQEVFARQVEALVGPNDLVVGISTSGTAENVLRGVRAAASKGATTVGLTGGTGGRLVALVDHALVMPAASTARIQELHTFVVHALSEQVDAWAAATQGHPEGRDDVGRRAGVNEG
jgi:phosphoheptose isomerase